MELTQSERELIVLWRTLLNNTTLEVTYRNNQPSVWYVFYPDFLKQRPLESYEVTPEEIEVIKIGRKLGWGRLHLVIEQDMNKVKPRVIGNTFKTGVFTTSKLEEPIEIYDKN